MAQELSCSVTADLIVTAQPETQLSTSHIHKQHNKKQVQYKKNPENKSQPCKAQ